MCGIGGAMNLTGQRVPRLARTLEVMNHLQRHRGPDGDGVWLHTRQHVGLAHRRLSIIDLGGGHQPMQDGQGNWITFNGEIYNYVELRRELGEQNFHTQSDTEVILRAYSRWGRDCVDHLRGMFAFALWDDATGKMFCARDRFGIKPFYYTCVGEMFYFASEAKALLPFVEHIEVDRQGLADYLTFQFCLEGKTLFRRVHELPPGHAMCVSTGTPEPYRYWEVFYNLDFDHTAPYFERRIQDLLSDSVRVHLRSDVPVGAYLSGGLDSSVVASLASRISPADFEGYTGKFACGDSYDESPYAREVARSCDFKLREIDIQPDDFADNIRKVIYHLDYPVAGPGSFPQYMVSQLAGRHRKVVLGGQGGDEIFGGYTRYLIAYFEQCIRGAIEGTTDNPNFIVTYESIIPNLRALRSYKPLLKHFWHEGLFEEMDRRYFRLINRAPVISDEVDWHALSGYDPFEAFRRIFRASNVDRDCYFDSMTHFDFKTLLPALLQVEDRVSMAHGLESRVPLLDHPLVELAATIPANVKFTNGRMKHVFRDAIRQWIPPAIADREDKMGFPVPLTEWIGGPLREFVVETLSTQHARERGLINNRLVVERMNGETKFGRQLWGFLSLELWHQEFVDRESEYRRLLSGGPLSAEGDTDDPQVRRAA